MDLAIVVVNDYDAVNRTQNASSLETALGGIPHYANRTIRLGDAEITLTGEEKICIGVR